MPATSTAPQLPAELLLSAVSHLRRHDLAQVCKANSYIRSLARPLFYRFGTITKFGLHFPGAPSPYPFLDLPELGYASLSSDTLERITSCLRQVDLPTYTASDCAAYWNLGLEDKVWKPFSVSSALVDFWWDRKTTNASQDVTSLTQRPIRPDNVTAPQMARAHATSPATADYASTIVHFGVS